MSNAPLFHVLLDRLEAINAPPMEIQRFVDRWHRQRPHEAFPCPVCFLAGEEQPLALLPPQGSVEPAVCLACGSQFNVPIDES